jgi:hypothetical protein
VTGSLQSSYTCCPQVGSSSHRASDSAGLPLWALGSLVSETYSLPWYLLPALAEAGGRTVLCLNPCSWTREGWIVGRTLAKRPGTRMRDREGHRQHSPAAQPQSMTPPNSSRYIMASPVDRSPPFMSSSLTDTRGCGGPCHVGPLPSEIG